MEIKLHETAFIIALYRARNQSESKDPYARLWLRPGLEKWADDFAEKVSVYDEILHCMRNRIMHQAIEAFHQQNPELLCLNLGAGFSMYPYSLPEEIEHFEVDFDEVMKYKDLKTQEFTEKGDLPNRKVTRIPASITNSYDQIKIKDALSACSGTRKVIIIEGVFFFLDPDEIDNVISFCSEIMDVGDRLICNSFDRELADTDVFKRLQEYFSQELQSDGHTTTIPHEFYSTIPGLDFIRRSSTLEMAKDLGIIPEEIEESSALNEYVYVLEKQ